MIYDTSTSSHILTPDRQTFDRINDAIHISKKNKMEISPGEISSEKFILSLSKDIPDLSKIIKVTKSDFIKYGQHAKEIEKELYKNKDKFTLSFIKLLEEGKLSQNQSATFLMIDVIFAHTHLSFHTELYQIVLDNIVNSTDGEFDHHMKMQTLERLVETEVGLQEISEHLYYLPGQKMLEKMIQKIMLK